MVSNIRHQHQCNRQILRFEWLQKIVYHQPLVIANDKTWKFRLFDLINSFVVDVTGFFSRCFDLAVKCKISQDVNTWTGNYRVVGKGSWNNEKLESWQVRHESGLNEVGKFGLKLENSVWSWKVRVEAGKFGLKLESDWWQNYRCKNDLLIKLTQIYKKYYQINSNTQPDVGLLLLSGFSWSWSSSWSVL